MFFSQDPNDEVQSKIYIDYIKYMNQEDDLEAMIQDEILDIYVDPNGIFHYYISDKTKNMLGDTLKYFKPTFATFADILETKGLTINRYNRYKIMLRRKSM